VLQPGLPAMNTPGRSTRPGPWSYVHARCLSSLSLLSDLVWKDFFFCFGKMDNSFGAFNFCAQNIRIQRSEHLKFLASCGCDGGAGVVACQICNRGLGLPCILVVCICGFGQL
jgi:hypothetical protein